ncbi:serine hydrolase domain-containing protein [uncultured Sphingomonas sp.]|uniref:serine hydrolase domain-containing protein n=1 Tax=uncultured Sphingomonas sp. TaxID=158754 RepID=UPI0035CAC6EC
MGRGKGPAAAGGGKGEGEHETPDQVARRYHLAGEVLVAQGDRILLERAYGPIAPSGGPQHKAGERWRLASITKQVVATMIVKSIDLAALDRPISAPEERASIGQLTLRQLLTHHTGLANPDDTPKLASGVPSFYAANEPDIGYCFSAPGRPGAAFAYNNCDYIIASFQLALHDADDPATWKGVHWAEPDERGVPGYVDGKPEPAFQLASWGAAGGLMGTAKAVFAFDRSLMTGKLLPPAALAELWKPEGHGSYQALGQWVFPGQLKGCAAPKRIVQRDGEIYGVQARNYILPDDGLVVIVFTNRSSGDFSIGEVWEGKGFAYDLLSAAVGC